MEAMNKNLTCPLCHRDDSTKMVSAVYFEYQNALVRQQPISELGAELGRQWAPPKPSTFHKSVKWAIELGGIISALLIFLISEYFRTISIGMSVFCILSYGLIFSFWYIFYGQYKSRKVWVEEDREFSSKKRIWGRLYYCSRDHLVFDTRTSIMGKPTELNALISKIARAT